MMKIAALDIALDRGGLLEVMKKPLIVISLPARVRNDCSLSFQADCLASSRRVAAISTSSALLAPASS